MRTQLRLTRRGALLTAIAGSAAGRCAYAQPAAPDVWPSLAAQIFNNRAIEDGGQLLAIEAPYRAEDAALVPIGMHILQPVSDDRRVETLSLVIDQNPSPLAATFTVGSGIRSISTRVRVDSYTNIHVVAAMAGGELYAVERFVKAAGGCSAPAAKQEANSIPLGSMRFRQFAGDAGASTREAQLLIRHPNYSGMQMNQVTRLYVPAHFVSSVHIWQGDELLLGIESGISISENPEFRFDYRPNGAAEFRAELQDSEGRSYKENWSATRA
jgi:sulfur-oxidizing protein SoxY